MNRKEICSFLLELGEAVRTEVSRILQEVPLSDRIQVDRHSGSDVIYRIDTAIEALIVQQVSKAAEDFGGIVLVAEGIGEEEVTVYPKECDADEAALRMIMDPIDGTRGIMYDKRSAFFLAGAAPNRGAETRLSDIEVAVMVECPTSRARLADSLWALRGRGARACTVDLVQDTRSYWTPAPAAATTIRGGFAQFSRFFPPGKDVLSAVEEELLRRIFPDAAPGEILTFEDQYICSGGQLYELLTGKDRFTAELRHSLYTSPGFAEQRIGHVCHPYDLAAHLVGSEAGLVLTAPDGQPLDAPLDTRAGSDWIGYANPHIQQEIEPVLLPLLKEHGLIN